MGSKQAAGKKDTLNSYSRGLEIEKSVHAIAETLSWVKRKGVPFQPTATSHYNICCVAILPSGPHALKNQWQGSSKRSPFICEVAKRGFL
jgi:hypothetical protein